MEIGAIFAKWLGGLQDPLMVFMAIVIAALVIDRIRISKQLQISSDKHMDDLKTIIPAMERNTAALERNTAMIGALKDALHTDRPVRRS